MITFEDVRVPASQLVGQPGEGGMLAMQTFHKTRPQVAAMAVGIASRALDEAAKYSLERKTFGVPIAQHQVPLSMLEAFQLQIPGSRFHACRHGEESRAGPFDRLQSCGRIR